MWFSPSAGGRKTTASCAGACKTPWPPAARCGGAFLEGRLKGFASVEGPLVGSQKQYADLTSIHVSADARGHGLGRQLFRRAEETGRRLGAKALYISAHSSVESQAFYKAMGCVEATEYIPAHVEQEPCDCQLECPL